MSKPTILRETPECPYCKAKNPPPTNRYEASREMHCAGCRRAFIVETHVRYSTAEIAGNEIATHIDDFIVGYASDHTLSDSYVSHVAPLFEDDISPKDRNAGLWALFMEAFPFIEKLRDSHDHNFTLLSNNRTIRVYHPKGCLCPNPPPKPL